MWCWLRLDVTDGSLNGDAEGDWLLLLVCCHCDVASGVSRGEGGWWKRDGQGESAGQGLVDQKDPFSRRAADAVKAALAGVVRLVKLYSIYDSTCMGLS